MKLLIPNHLNYRNCAIARFSKVYISLLHFLTTTLKSTAFKNNASQETSNTKFLSRIGVKEPHRGEKDYKEEK